MSSERTEQFSQSAAAQSQSTDVVEPHHEVIAVGSATHEPTQKRAPRESAPKDAAPKDSSSHGAGSKESEPKNQETTILVRGETVNKDSKSGADSSAKGKDSPPPKPVSEAKVGMQRRLPALADDGDAGALKDQLVTRDGKADLRFQGTLLASAAPPSAPQGQWQEYRIYETTAGKHVFSKVTRNVIAEQQDVYEAEVFDPAPSSVPSKLLRSARDLTHSHPMTWQDAAVAFFGYEPLAKTLYRKLSGQFEEHIT
jgi:hypothetical protein